MPGLYNHNGYFDMYHQYNPYDDHPVANEDEWREWENDVYYTNSLSNKRLLTSKPGPKGYEKELFGD